MSDISGRKLLQLVMDFERSNTFWHLFTLDEHEKEIKTEFIWFNLWINGRINRQREYYCSYKFLIIELFTGII
jgi:hypothetical protein